MPSAQLKLNPLTLVTLQSPELMNGSRLHRYPSLYQLNTRENHDEPRAGVTFALQKHQAAAVLTYLCSGLRFFHEGQFERVPIHLDRQPAEPGEPILRDSSARLLDCVDRPGDRGRGLGLLEAALAWGANRTYDCFVCLAWYTQGIPPLVVVNCAPNQSQRYLRFPFDEIRGQTLRTLDLLSSVVYQHAGEELVLGGMFFDLPAWGYHAFKLETR